MGALKKAFRDIGRAVEQTVKGAVQFAKGVVTLDLKGAAEGLSKLTNGLTQIGVAAINLTPAAMAANSLLKGGLSKILDKATNEINKIQESMISNLMEPLQKIKQGAIGFVKGIAKGDIKQAMEGIKNIVMGALETASNFGPGGVAKNVARLAVDAAIDAAAQKAASAAAKVLDPNGSSAIGGLAADAVGAAVAGGLSSGRAGPRANGAQSVSDDIALAGRTAGAEATAVMRDGLSDMARQQLDEHAANVLGATGLPLENVSELSSFQSSAMGSMPAAVGNAASRRGGVAEARDTATAAAGSTRDDLRSSATSGMTQIGGKAGLNDSIAEMRESLVDAATAKLNEALAMVPVDRELLEIASTAGELGAVSRTQRRSTEGGSPASGDGSPGVRADRRQPSEGAEPTGRAGPVSREQAVREAIEGLMAAAVYAGVLQGIVEALDELPQEKMIGLGALKRLTDHPEGRGVRLQLSDSIEGMARRTLDDRSAALEPRLMRCGSEKVRGVVSDEVRQVGDSLASDVMKLLQEVAAKCQDLGLGEVASRLDRRLAEKNQVIEMSAVRA